DLYSIIVYLRSISPIEKNVSKTELDFPVNLIIKTLPKKPDFQMKLNPKDTIQHGAYLVNAAGCIDCHSKRDKGKLIPGTEFAGGMQFKFEEGTLTAPNITMHKTSGIGNWTKEMFVSKFKIYAGDRINLGGIGKTIYNTPMPWVQYAGMTESDLAAIYSYLTSLKPNPNKVVTRTFN
ncbi:MAG: c-type cytochrome, partial [Sphingobacteriales bacterium]